MKHIRTLAAGLACALVSLPAMSGGTGVIATAVEGEHVPVQRSLGGQLMPTATPAEVLCNAVNGDQIEILKAVARDGATEFWLLVKVVTGTCAGTQGWIRSSQAKPLD